METLKEIGDRLMRGGGERSNKIQSSHNYVCLYGSLFSEYRASATKVVEVGAGYGGSLRLWYHYFFKAHIYGLDIDVERMPSLAAIRSRVSTHKVDQSSTEQLNAFAEEHRQFDIVIDDGSHVWDHQIRTFETLFPHVREGGLYVIEDTDTSYFQKFAGGGITCMEYFKDIADELNMYGGTHWKDKRNRSIDHSKLTKHQKKIEWLMFSRTMIVLKKRAAKDVPVWGV